MLPPMLLVNLKELECGIQRELPGLALGTRGLLSAITDRHLEATRERLLDALWPLENAQPPRDPQLVDSEPFGERLRRCEPVLLHHVRVGGALLCRREVLALNILE